MYTQADYAYNRIIYRLLALGEEVTTRNHDVYRCIDLSETFTSVPLISVRNVAVKKALLELEWFLSGDDKCPEHLKDWWEGQLNENGEYKNGYAYQLRGKYDQIEYVVKALRDHPYSRRICLSTWDTKDMEEITEVNNNPKSPATCHLSFCQFFVDVSGNVHMKQYQRSCDALLGLPHNWVQHYALLVYVARRAKLQPGSYQWVGGDVHLYKEKSHLNCAKEIVDEFDVGRMLTEDYLEVETYYIPADEKFRADDFAFDKSKLAKPLSTRRPKLL